MVAGARRRLRSALVLLAVGIGAGTALMVRGVLVPKGAGLVVAGLVVVVATAVLAAARAAPAVAVLSKQAESDS